MTLRAFLLVGMGGMLGAMLRFGIMTGIGSGLGMATAVGTLVVNIIGSFIIGGLHWYGFQHHALSPDVKTFLMPGMLGGFTTFSTFALDSVSLFGRGHYLECVAYLVASVTFSIIALLAGMVLMRWLVS
jgi:fluoride exporter